MSETTTVQVPLWILRHPRLSATEKLFWVQIKVWMEAAPGQNPTRGQLADHAGLRKAPASRAVTRLVEVGALTLSENLGDRRRARGAQEIRLAEAEADPGFPLADVSQLRKRPPRRMRPVPAEKVTPAPARQGEFIARTPLKPGTALAETVAPAPDHRASVCSSSSTSTSTTVVRTPVVSPTVRTPYPPRFTTFWDTYPQKKGKKATFAWWTTHKVEDDVELYGTILAGVHRYIQSSRNEGRDNNARYTLHPITFLRGERYLDDVSPPPTTPVSAQTKSIVSASQRFLQRHQG